MKRQINLKVENLETRTLLSTTYFPSDFVGPLPTEAVVYTAVADPIVTPMRLSKSIGGAVGYNVSVPSGSAYGFKSVKYSIVGGAVASQSWTNNYSNTVRTSGFTHSWTSNFPKNDTASFFWDEKPGTRTVTITTTFSDPASTVKTYTSVISVVAPKVNFFRIEGEDTLFGNQGTELGFYQFSKTMFKAEIGTMPDLNGGKFGFIQIVDAYEKFTGNTITKTTDFPDNKSILDWNGNFTPHVQSYFAYMGYNEINKPVGKFGDAYDSPAMMVSDPTKWKALSMNLYFDVYLDYQPSEGIHVSIGYATWQMVGFASKSSTGVWTYSVQNKDSWVSQGDTSRSIIGWDMNSQTAMSIYTTTV